MVVTPRYRSGARGNQIYQLPRQGLSDLWIWHIHQLAWLCCAADVTGCWRQNRSALSSTTYSNGVCPSTKYASKSSLLKHYAPYFCTNSRKYPSTRGALRILDRASTQGTKFRLSNPFPLIGE